MTAKERQILEALEAASEDHGIDIVDVEVVGTAKLPCVRVRIDTLTPEFITLDEVTENTHWISQLIEELDPFKESYTLEVSSPGIDRPLRRPCDFKAHIGKRVEILLNKPVVDGRRKFAGVLKVATEDGIVLQESETISSSTNYINIKKAHVKAEIDFKSSKGAQ